MSTLPANPVEQQAAALQITQWKQERANLLADVGKKIARISIIDAQLGVLWDKAGVTPETLPAAPTLAPGSSVPPNIVIAPAPAAPAAPSSTTVSGAPIPTPAPAAK